MQAIVKAIQLTKGQVALVDDQDFENLSEFKWCATWNPYTRSYYAVRSFRIAGKSHTIIMHREILGLKYGDGVIGDHRNGQTLDNTRENLRAATPGESQRNRGLQRNSKTGFKGVHRRGATKYAARIMFNGKRIHLGIRNTPEEAHALYCDAALALYGEFARRA